MSKLKQILLGTAARTSISLPLGGQAIPVDVRPITAAEEVAALAQARSLAIKQGVEDPREGNSIYDLLVMASVVLIGCVDHDSPQDKPEPFCESIEQVLSLGRDSVVYLYEAQEAWQEKTSPRRRKLSPEEYLALVVQLAASDEEDDALDPFARWPRATLVSCMRTMASQLLSSPGPRSQPTSSPAASGETALSRGTNEGA